MFKELKRIVGKDNFSCDKENLEAYSRDSSFLRAAPLCVVSPKNRDEVTGIVKFASKKRVAVIPRGAGTNPCGEVVGRAIVIDMSKMDRILELNTEDMYAVVEPGVVRDRINSELEQFGLFFPPDPASSKVATIGGMVSNNSSGLHAVKYGTTKDYVLSLEVVLSNGEAIEVGTLALKSSSGYDLKGLFVGSEGTLGVTTKIALHLLPLPEKRCTVSFCVESFEELQDFQTEILKYMPSAFEFMDSICLKVISHRHGIDFGEAEALVVVEFDGSPHQVDSFVQEIKKKWDTKEIRDIWDIRKGLVPLLGTYGEKMPIAITEDIGVPVSRIVETIQRVKDIYRVAGYEVAVYGHLGDGNLHMRVFGEYSEELQVAADRVYDHVLSLGGTISSEHGIGRLRKRYMEQAHGRTLGIMRKIKVTIDPEGILNPGCLFD